MFKDGDKANKLGTDFKNLNKNKTYTAKGFSATSSFIDSAFSFFPNFALPQVRSKQPADILFFFIPYAQINPFELLASYSHVPYLKHNMYVCIGNASCWCDIDVS